MIIFISSSSCFSPAYPIHKWILDCQLDFQFSSSDQHDVFGWPAGNPACHFMLHSDRELSDAFDWISSNLGFDRLEEIAKRERVDEQKDRASSSRFTSSISDFWRNSFSCETHIHTNRGTYPLSFDRCFTIFLISENLCPLLIQTLLKRMRGGRIPFPAQNCNKTCVQGLSCGFTHMWNTHLVSHGFSDSLETWLQ